jgi:competence ComEA-like helix-hairpin-helix protein
MANNTPVKINLAAEEEIARLYGIGPQLAGRIVRHREAQGPFRKPEDLAVIEGISLDLAITLAPHIDWQISSEPAERSDWVNPVAFLIAIMIGAWFIYRVAWPDFDVSVRNFEGRFEDYLLIWIQGSILLACIFSFLGAVSFFLTFLFPSQEKKIFRLVLVLIGCIVVSILSVGLGNLIYYQFVAERGWAQLLGNQFAIAGLLSGIMVAFLAVPNLVFMFYPSVRFGPFFLRTYDLFVALGGVLTAWIVWVFRNVLPLWMLLALGFFGGIILFLGIDLLRTRRSALEVIQASLVDSSALRRVRETNFWKTWVNARLPDPEQQKELKRALEELHPTSRLRTISGLLIFGAGGWILGTVLSSIVEWIVQNWLNTFVP